MQNIARIELNSIDAYVPIVTSRWILAVLPLKI